jgi:hypothetical protein
MAKGGRKYRLLLYERIINHYLPAIFTLGLVVLLNVGVLWGAEWYFTNPDENPMMRLSTEGGLVMLVIGGLVLAFWIFLLFARKMAYIQLFDDYLRLATPFLRLNISYKRIHHTTTAQVGDLFPPKQINEWGRDIIGPLASKTAVIIHLTAYPKAMSRNALKLFLSKFFFYDKTPHFILTVDDWMRFSQELDSRRSGVKTPPRQKAAPRPRITSGLLDDLKRK